jgi:hypothetical protein
LVNTLKRGFCAGIEADWKLNDKASLDARVECKGNLYKVYRL